MERKIKTYHIDIVLREFSGVYTYTLAGLLPAGVPMYDAHQIAHGVVRSAEAKSPSARAVGGLAHGQYVPADGQIGPRIHYTSRSGKTYIIEELHEADGTPRWRFTYPEDSHLARIFGDLGSDESPARPQS